MISATMQSACEHHLQRGAQGCLCCGSAELVKTASVVSPFLASRAWGGEPEPTALYFCVNCGFRFYARGITMEEAARYYTNYHDEEYYRLRNHFEPFYTRKVHMGTHAWMSQADRHHALWQILRPANAPEFFRSALDYGGGSGFMLECVNAARKAVFDLSGETPVIGMEVFSCRENIQETWELLLSSHVLEHLSDPLDHLRDIASLLEPNGWVYAEVPSQHWKNYSAPLAMQEAWIRWLCGKPWMLKAWDVLSTGVRVKLGKLPPFGFVPMREHVNFFTADALRNLLSRAGFQVVHQGRNPEGNHCIVARSKVAQPDRAQ